MEWEDAASEITNVELSVEISAKGEARITEFLHVERLGTYAMDNTAEATFETARCLSGRPRMFVQTATGSVEGKKMDLVKNKSLLIGSVEHFPLGIKVTPHHTPKPERKTEQFRGVNH